MQKILLTDATFGNNLQNIRLAKGLTQEQTAAKLQLLGSKITRGTYSLIELGRANIYISDLVGLKQVFDVDYAEFFKGIAPTR